LNVKIVIKRGLLNIISFILEKIETANPKNEKFLNYT
jgi:hypothetical protein